MTFANNTVRPALDLSINFTFRSNSYLDTLDLLDLAFQRRLISCAMNMVLSAPTDSTARIRCPTYEGKLLWQTFAVIYT